MKTQTFEIPGRLEGGPRPVIVCSPFAAATARERRANQRYARQCLRDSLERGEAPFLSHLLYPQVLDDTKPNERQAGMAAGDAWLMLCPRLVLYVDRGVSPGMLQTLERWWALRPIQPTASLEIRRLIPARPQQEHKEASR